MVKCINNGHSCCFILLELGDCSLEVLNMACLTHYLDSLFCIFPILNKEGLSVNGLWGIFAAYKEWVLESCGGSSFTLCTAEKDMTSPILDPEPSQSPTMPITDFMHEPTTDREPEPATEKVPEPTPVMCSLIPGHCQDSGSSALHILLFI